jgi:hypothetical protein
MGVLISRTTDKDLFEKAVNETHSIIQSAEQIPLKKTDRNFSANSKKDGNSNSKKVYRGYCIRCESRINYGPHKPYCEDCYYIWAQYSNPQYQENVCHKCGEYELTSMEKPQCYSCYKESQNPNN